MVSETYEKHFEYMCNCFEPEYCNCVGGERRKIFRAYTIIKIVAKL